MCCFVLLIPTPEEYHDDRDSAVGCRLPVNLNVFGLSRFSSFPVRVRESGCQTRAVAPRVVAWWCCMHVALRGAAHRGLGRRACAAWACAVALAALLAPGARPGSVQFGLWSVCFPPVLVRTGRRLPVQALGERRVWVTLTGYPRDGAPGP